MIQLHDVLERLDHRSQPGYEVGVLLALGHKGVRKVNQANGDVGLVCRLGISLVDDQHAAGVELEVPLHLQPDVC